MDRKIKGKAAEDLAASFLKSKKYEILDRNFKTKFGEIDIIARDGNCIVFIEVRSKSYSFFGRPEETVNKEKIKKIIKTAQFYIQTKNPSFSEVRFDIISILHNNISHIKNAFDMDFE